ncbi:hypothetical protein KXQ82_13765 [Mucilaginibacter sp. HMF5004]|uniref:hypothetical protein n=1 Tax=Mucilaginibacter rivuli TaxID=2857527 RepID=UPI001C6064BF|nr:hypothetical protein [Mucilaginibacter rivuli]MBW4890793.1 hypothetical protein [Mucilaginibacter rivuli]
MKINIKHLPDVLFRYRQRLEYFSLFLLVFVVIANFDKIREDKPWEDTSLVLSICIVLSIIIAMIWVRVQLIKANILAREIKRNVVPKGPERDALIEKLSTRQREILELLLLKIPNREIMGELSIEHRAFKSHMDRIYRVLFRIKAGKSQAA